VELSLLPVAQQEGMSWCLLLVIDEVKINSGRPEQETFPGK
jgi:hypothetical protein